MQQSKTKKRGRKHDTTAGNQTRACSGPLGALPFDRSHHVCLDLLLRSNSSKIGDKQQPEQSYFWPLKRAKQKQKQNQIPN